MNLLRLAVGISLLLLGAGCDSSADTKSPVSSGPSSTTTSSSSQPAPDSPGSTVEGFRGVEDFPISFVVPQDFEESDEGNGTRTYDIAGTSGSAAAFLLESLGGVRAADVPDDVAHFIRDNRPDLRVSDIGTTEVGRYRAQTFTLTQGPTAPLDLWCAEQGTCFKLLVDKPMDVTAVRTDQDLVLFTVEYLPADRDLVTGPMKRWLGSVRWQ